MKELGLLPKGIMPCSPMKVNQHFEITYRFHFYGRKENQTRNQHEAGRKLNLKMEEIYPCQNSFEFHRATL